MSAINERDFEILNELRGVNDSGVAWARPLDCGGHDGSDHSYRLSKLAKVGLAEVRWRAAHYSRGAKEYRITQDGRGTLSDWFELRSKQEQPDV